MAAKRHRQVRSPSPVQEHPKKRVSRPSARQKLIDSAREQQANHKLQKEANELRRLLAESRAQNKQQRALQDATNKRLRQYEDEADEAYAAAHNGRSRPESEDDDDINPVLALPNAIRSLGTVTVDQPPRKRLRKQGEPRHPHTPPPPAETDDLMNFDDEQPRTKDSSASLAAPSTPTSVPPIAPESPEAEQEPGPEDTDVQLPSAPVKPNHNGKNIHDYEQPVHDMLLQACKVYEKDLVCIHAYPTAAEANERVVQCWADVCKEFEHEYQLSKRMRRIIISRGSRERGAVKDRLRPYIAPTFGFRDSSDKRVISRNKDIYVKLTTDGAFTCKDIDALRFRYEGDIIYQGFRLAWFAKKTDFGVVFEEAFDPAPLPALAFVCFMVEWLLEEWCTGTFQQGTLNETQDRAQYERHLQDIKKWASSNTQVTTNIRGKWYTRARKSTGAQPRTVTSGLTAKDIDQMRDDLRGRTGETDSEFEEDEEAGHGKRQDGDANSGGDGDEDQ